MKIRAATAEDLPAVLSLVPRLAATGCPPGRDAAEVERSDTQSMTRAVTAPASGEAVFVAEENGQLAGVVHLKTVMDYFSQKPIVHIADIVVAQAAEGTGIGKTLMKAAEDWARTCGYTMVQLHVLVGNARARAMYERLGYCAEWLKYIKRLD